jgi:hypothetical protein
MPCNTTKFITSYLVVLDGITYTLLYCYQHNGMDSNEYNIIYDYKKYVRFMYCLITSDRRDGGKISSREMAIDMI